MPTRPTPETRYAIGDLARLSGVPVRTVRYYLAQGLLPPSGEPGPGAHYGQDHLHRLLLTKRLQRQHLPLAEIRRRLAELSGLEVEAALATSEATEEPSTALEYVRSVLAPPQESDREVLALRREAGGSLAPMAQSAPWPDGPDGERRPPPPATRSQWERLTLGPNLELHIRRPLSRLEQKRVERLITIARQVLKEDTP
jgi:DNA-binding transcriptional MerR regulator